ncbi:MAG: hypothetical protein U0835_01825 [Isosphaeraceae bacterium]
MSAGAGRAARRARVTIAGAAVAVVPPKQPRGEHGDAQIPVYVVAVREVDPPAGVDPLEWVLLTDLPADDLEGADRAARWYARRPVVEELHKGMKTGCGVETLQFTTEAALQPAIAVLSVVAVFLLGLRDAGRDPARGGATGVPVRAGPVRRGAQRVAARRAAGGLDAARVLPGAGAARRPPEPQG